MLFRIRAISPIETEKCEQKQGELDSSDDSDVSCKCVFAENESQKLENSRNSSAIHSEEEVNERPLKYSNSSKSHEENVIKLSQNSDNLSLNKSNKSKENANRAANSANLRCLNVENEENNNPFAENVVESLKASQDSNREGIH